MALRGVHMSDGNLCCGSSLAGIVARKSNGKEEPSIGLPTHLVAPVIENDGNF